MILSTILVLFATVVSVTYSAFECNPPVSSNGPLPPVLPDTYHMIYEVNNIETMETSFMDVWYDWPNQRARIEDISEGLGVVSIHNYADASSFVYFEPKPGREEKEDPDRDFDCQYYPMADYSDYNGEVRFYDRSERPLKMVDIYQALLFGGRYRYAYVETISNDNSRNILTNRFDACIVDRAHPEARLNISYYWTTDEDSPVKCTMYGGVELNGDLVNRTNLVLSVVKFDRNPDILPGTFTTPRDMHCVNDPSVVNVTDFPKMSAEFAWREETIKYSVKLDTKVVQNLTFDEYREVWSSDHLDLARMDWTPNSNSGSTFDAYKGQPITVVADMSYGALFITNTITGRCDVKPLTDDFPLSKNGGDKFVLKTTMELLGMTEAHILKGMYAERNNIVNVYIQRNGTNFNADFTTAHEATFRFDENLQAETFGFGFVPVSQLSRTMISDPENILDNKEIVEQKSYFHYRNTYSPYHMFEAPGCIAHHDRRFFEISFNGTSWTEVSKRKNEFLNQVRFETSLRGALGTVMRIQDLDMHLANDSNIVVSMTMLEPIKEISSRLNVTLDTAKADITSDVNNGVFAVSFEIGDDAVLIALNDSFKEVTFDGTYIIESPTMTLERAPLSGVGKSVQTVDTGYGDSSLVAVCVIALLLGVGVGFVAVRVYTAKQRKQIEDVVPLGSLSETELSEQPGPSGWSADK